MDGPVSVSHNGTNKKRGRLSVAPAPFLTPPADYGTSDNFVPYFALITPISSFATTT